MAGSCSSVLRLSPPLRKQCIPTSCQGLSAPVLLRFRPPGEHSWRHCRISVPAGCLRVCRHHGRQNRPCYRIPRFPYRCCSIRQRTCPPSAALLPPPCPQSRNAARFLLPADRNRRTCRRAMHRAHLSSRTPLGRFSGAGAGSKALYARTKPTGATPPADRITFSSSASFHFIDVALSEQPYQRNFQPGGAEIVALLGGLPYVTIVHRYIFMIFSAHIADAYRKVEV